MSLWSYDLSFKVVPIVYRNISAFVLKRKATLGRNFAKGKELKTFPSAFFHLNRKHVKDAFVIALSYCVILYVAHLARLKVPFA